MTPAQRAAEQIFARIYHGRMDETGRLTPTIAAIIESEYAERDAAVAELVKRANAVAAELFAVRRVRYPRLDNALAALAALEGK